MNTASPSESDIATNIGAMIAASYACRATRKPKMQPVPVVSTTRHTSATTPARRTWRCIRRSMCIHRYTTTTAMKPV